MSEENVETLKHSFEEAPENPEPFFAMLDENVEWDLSAPWSGREKLYGPEAVREFYRTWAGTFDEWRFETEEVIDAGSSVFTCLHQSGRGKGSGIPVENRYYAVWTFERNKVIRYQAFMGRTEALEAVGLSD
jgi:ketosteroid isomerase-like protein